MGALAEVLRAIVPSDVWRPDCAPIGGPPLRLGAWRETGADPEPT